MVDLWAVQSRKTNCFSLGLMKASKSAQPAELRRALRLRRYETATSPRSCRPLAPLFQVLLLLQIPRASHLLIAMLRQPVDAFTTQTPAMPMARAALPFRGISSPRIGLTPRQRQWLGYFLSRRWATPIPRPIFLTTSSRLEPLSTT